jgi:hypothetical protein
MPLFRKRFPYTLLDLTYYYKQSHSLYNYKPNASLYNKHFRAFVEINYKDKYDYSY